MRLPQGESGVSARTDPLSGAAGLRYLTLLRLDAELRSFGTEDPVKRACERDGFLLALELVAKRLSAAGPERQDHAA